MNENFKYAPGKPGIGTKGRDGSVGSQGLSMFFTDLDPINDKGTISIRIATNATLWSSNSNLSNLPDGRMYNVGDLFIAQSGETYEITNTTTGSFSKIFANLSSGGFFLPLGVTSTDGYVRFFNSNTTPKVIIDNVYTDSGAINYTASPVSIYGIQPQEFARIEYSNVLINNRNPFTVFSSGIVGGSTDDAKAIAIVRETSGNTFRIGNLDSAGNLRNVNLTFDVSLLSQTKQTGNGFNKNTPSGAILTNYEIGANSLFDPAFNANPASFTASFNSGALSSTISWKLSDFTNDSNVTGTLYFVTRGQPYSGSYAFDSLTYKPLIFQDVQSTGSVTITNLSVSNVYTCYMKLSMPNGWTRNSASINAFASSLSVAPLNFDPDSSSAHIDHFVVTSNTAWIASFDPAFNPDNFMTLNASTMASFNGTLDVNIATNAASAYRLGKINFSPVLGGLTIPVNINQIYGYQPPSTPTITQNFTQVFPQQSYIYPGQAGVTYTTEALKSNYVWTVTGATSFTGQGTNQITVIWNSTPVSYSGIITVHYTDGGGVSTTTTYNATIQHTLFTSPGSPIFFSPTSGNSCTVGNNFFTVWATPGHQWYADVPLAQNWVHLNNANTRYPTSGTISGTGAAQTVPVAITASHGYGSTQVTVHAITDPIGNGSVPIVAGGCA